jgi:purine-binding chemotaxis protein CheW
MIDAARTHVLLVRLGRAFGALPTADVVETMRPLDTQPVQGLPPYVMGVAVVRGAPVPVVDLVRLATGEAGIELRRFVTVRLAGRLAALAVNEVVGVREIDAGQLGALPPLVDPGRFASLGRVDDRLLLGLERSRVLLEDLVLALDARA